MASSFLQAGLDWLGGLSLARQSFSVTITRTISGAIYTATVSAQPLRTAFVAEETGEIIHQHRWRDWRIKAADYVLTDPSDVPTRGDLITYITDDGVEHVFEVLPPSGKELPDLAIDPQYRWLRVHSKEQ